MYFFDNYKEKLFVKKTVHEVLFGYEDPIFELYLELKKKYPFLNFLPDINPVFLMQPNGHLFWDDSRTHRSKKHCGFRNVGRMAGKEGCGSLEVKICQYDKWIKWQSISSRHNHSRHSPLSFPYTTMQFSV